MNAFANRVPGVPENRPAYDTDVIIIGAGPAGMSAAIDLAAAGRRVIVLDMQPAPGGQIFRSLEANLASQPATDELLAALGPAYRAGEALIARFRAAREIDYRPDTTVWDLRHDGTVGWLKGEAAGYVRAPHVILATGAMERPVPFPGWTLPGVMTAGAVQTLLKAGRLKPQGRVVLAGTGPLIFLLAEQLRCLGIRPALVARTDRISDMIRAARWIRPSAIPAILKGAVWMAKLKLAGIPMSTGISELSAQGVGRVESVSLMVAGRKMTIPCDLLIVHDGIVPSMDLAHGAGLALEWQEGDASWRPKTSLDGKVELVPGPALVDGPCRIRISGDARVIGGADAAIAHGRHVAAEILAEARAEGGVGVKPGQDNGSGTAAAVQRAMAYRPFIEAAFPMGLARELPPDDAIVCRCEELTAGTLRATIAQGATSMDLIRGTQRCGMGPCQGRSCSATLARLLREAHPQSQPTPFRPRPPFRPLPLGALAKLEGADPELAQIISLEDKPNAPLEEADPHA
ncbi:FAD-dependent oxidoreductase [Rhizobium sp. NPDC090275]|uniref:FAD-dependent oxidoreductase n=1 Tax=Rhizobium sp. NPDC090275 TaxID=3364498 RepID=UPI00383A0634